MRAGREPSAEAAKIDFVAALQGQGSCYEVFKEKERIITSSHFYPNKFFKFTVLSYLLFFAYLK